MSDDRMIEAVARIERALARIESATTRQSDAMLAEFTELFQKHETLRTKAAAAVERLDQLVEAGPEA